MLTLSGSNNYSGDTTVNGGTLVVSATSNLGTAANSLLLNFGALKTSGGGVSGGSRAISVTPAGGTFNTNGFNSSFGDLTVGTNSVSNSTFNKDGAGQLSLSSMRGGFIAINAGQIQISGSRAAAHTSVVRGVTLAGASNAWTSGLDLGANDLIIDYTPVNHLLPTVSPFATVLNQLKSGAAGGAWTGTTGITSSSAAAAQLTAHPTALGTAEAAEIFGGFPATFSGQSIGSNSVLVRYTYAGDADLNGSVDTMDFSKLAANFGSTGARWITGDFNYDGVVDTRDFNVLAANFGQSLPSEPAGVGAVVPEPSALLLSAVPFVLHRRRRRM